jgi:peptidoglycan hydrolase-like protein with peptidoglycan-binding domain
MAYTEIQKQAHIREIQGYLHGLSHIQNSIRPLAPDGIYGKETATAVLEFQRQHALHPTGAIDTATWNAIVAAYLEEFPPASEEIPLFSLGIKAYAMGDSGTNVLLIQAVLEGIHRSFFNLPSVQLTGEYTENTAKAVRGFQKVSGFPETGIVTPKVWRRMLGCIIDNTAQK